MPFKRNRQQDDPNMILQLECVDDELSEVQKSMFEKAEQEFMLLKQNLDHMAKSSGVTVIQEGAAVCYESVNSDLPLISPVGIAAVNPSVTNAIKVPKTNAGFPVVISAPDTTLQTPPNSVAVVPTSTPGSFQLVNLLVPSIAPNAGLSVIQSSHTIQESAKVPQPVVTPQGKLIPKTTVAKSGTPSSVSSIGPVAKHSPQLTTLKAKPLASMTGDVSTRTNKAQIVAPVTPIAKNITAQTRLKAKTVASISGEVTTKKSSTQKIDNAPIVDLTDDDSAPVSTTPASTTPTNPTPRPNINNSNPQNKSDKLFPSLMIVVRPYFGPKCVPNVSIDQERKTLDLNIRGVLQYPATKFSEWLFQQGLVRSEQNCNVHFNRDKSPMKLKLGMYSDTSKFPYSGGYVWISDCCPQRYVSIYSGSIFESATHPPSVLLKLIYHWACQTSIQNVAQWVKVDAVYNKNFYRLLRSVCTLAVHENYGKIGGPKKKVELGVISIGSASKDGTKKHVKVEILGILEPNSKLLRLRAVQPLQEGEKNNKDRWLGILRPLENWIHKESTIITDFTVNRSILVQLGFINIVQLPSPKSEPGNKNIMTYLREIVPKMFQSTLSLLSTPMIQQFLDELVWRERWGPYPAKAFDSIVTHLAELTKVDAGESLVKRLNSVANNPLDMDLLNQKGNLTQVPAMVVNGTAVGTSPSNKPIASKKTSNQRNNRINGVASTAAAPVTPPAPMQQSAPASVKRSYTPSPTPSNKKAKRTSAADIPAAPPARTQQDFVQLDTYYYGKMQGDKEIISSEVKSSIDIQCCSCQKKFSNNILLMKHIIQHAHNDKQLSPDLSDLTQCKYCLRCFPTPFSMQTHMEEVHLKANSSNVCHICEEQFKDKNTLIKHMHTVHVPLEMPYECRICKFRSSLHRDVIDHFHEVHNGGEKIQCPFCLKIVIFCSSKKKLTNNIFMYFAHLQQHQKKTVAKKCDRCSLSFVEKGLLRDHQVNDHISFRDFEGVEPCTSFPDSGIMMPTPPNQHYQRNSSVYRPVPNKTTYANLDIRMPNVKKAPYNTVQLLKDIVLNDISSGLKCLECKDDLKEANHFPAYVTCGLCPFATCCKKQAEEHSKSPHYQSLRSDPNNSLGKSKPLVKKLYCICGYTSNCGNTLSKHLVICNRKSAYPLAMLVKKKDSQSASFPPLITLDDAEAASDDPSDKWLRAFVSNRKDNGESSRDATEQTPAGEGDPSSMLNILGLVRKPDSKAEENSDGENN